MMMNDTLFTVATETEHERGENLTYTKRPFTSVTEERNKYIGGSDAGTIMGVNPWKSAYTLWLEKTGQIEVPDISNKLSVWFGTEEEEIVAKRFCLETGKQVRKSNLQYSCVEYPFLVGHVDRMVVGEDAGLECKTTSAWNKTDYQEGEIPPSHYWQCMHYMLVTGKTKWYIATKRDNTGFYYVYIERNEEAIEALLQAEIDFWQCVQTNTAPEIDSSKSTSESLNEQYEEIEDSIDLTLEGEYSDKCMMIMKIDEQIKELESTKTGLQNEIKSRMGEYSLATLNGFKTIWKTQNRSTLDSKKLKVDYPDIYERYKKESSTRIFKITKMKEEEK